MLTKELLQAVQNHELSVEQAMEQLKDLPYHNMNMPNWIITDNYEQDFRKLFLHKEKRLHNSVIFSIHCMNATKLLWPHE